MRNYRFTVINILMLLIGVFICQSCQKQYEMVDPPFILEGDDLDEEVIIPDDLDCYFVTPKGKGNMDGSTWDNAMSEDALYNLIRVNDNSDITLSNAEMLDGKYIYLSGGTYNVIKNNKGININFNEYVSSVKFIIEGGYDPSSVGIDLTKRNCEEFQTILTRTEDNTAINTMNSMFQINSKVDITFDGCIFDGIYTNDSQGILRAFYSSAADNKLNIKNCIIKNFNVINDKTSLAGRGGALNIQKGNVYLNNVRIIDNAANNRGGAINLLDKDCLLFMNGCTLSNNIVSGDWSTAIHTGGGARMCMNNTTILGGEGSGSRSIIVNGDGFFIFSNTTIISNKNNNYGALRSPTNAALLVNSLILKGEGSRTIYSDGKTCISKGYNIYQAADAGWSGIETDTDMSNSNFPIPELKNGIYEWSIDEVGTINAFATRTAVIDAVRSYMADEFTLGERFVEWCGEDSFGKDARGVERNPEKMQSGAFDSVLE